MWTTSDAVALRNFLAQNPRVLLELHKRAPKINGDTVEKSAMTGQNHAGYSEVFTALEEMQLDVAPPVQLTNNPI